MTFINWCDIFQWGEEELEDLRFVAYSYVKQGKYDFAIAFFEFLSFLNPNQAYEKQILGALHLQKGNHYQALSFLNQALKIDPKHSPSLLNRSKVLLSLGYKKQALETAELLQACEDREIASQASALFLAYTL